MHRPMFHELYGAPAGTPINKEKLMPFDPYQVAKRAVEQLQETVPAFAALHSQALGRVIVVVEREARKEFNAYLEEEKNKDERKKEVQRATEEPWKNFKSGMTENER